MKKRKGMTLIEVIVSLAIYGIMAMLVAEIMTLVNATMRATNQLNDRLSYEAKFADNLQTVDDRGNALSATVVNFQIRYNNNSQIVGGASREALEYTAQYDNSHVVGQRYSENVNYRFMTFDRVASNRSAFPGEMFQVSIRPVPYFSADEGSLSDAEKQALVASANSIISTITELKIETETGTDFFPLGSGVSELNFTNGDVMLGSDIQVQIFNTSEAIPDSVQTVEANLKFNTKRDFFHDGVSREWNKDVPGRIYLYVKVGSSSDNATYYNQCLFEWNINTGEFNVSRSYTVDDVFPLPPVYP